MTIEILVPLDKNSYNDPVHLNDSHQRRNFILFDEDLEILLFSKNSQLQLKQLCVTINDATVFKNSGNSCVMKVGENLWKVDPEVVRTRIFNSSMVLNNGHKNILSIKLEYYENKEPLQSRSSPENEDLLPSFQPLNSKSNKKKSHFKNSITTAKFGTAEVLSASLTYPIHSLLNVRLRNFLLSSKNKTLSSLDFQVSKSITILAQQYELQELEIFVDLVKYELLDECSQVEVRPMCLLELPLILSQQDSYSINYQLPYTNVAQQRVRITLYYKVRERTNEFRINTSWETDITVKGAPNCLSQPPSALPTPTLYQSSPNMRRSVSAVSLFMQNKLSNVKFNFLENRITARKGSTFKMDLQISNVSQRSLNMVVYYSTGVSNTNSGTSIEQDYHLNKRYRKTVGGIILLSNDYKLPIIQPGETYCITLELIGIASGYYHTLPGLKILDLDTKEVVDIGVGASALIN